MKTLSLELNLDSNKIGEDSRKLIAEVGQVGIFELMLNQAFSGVHKDGIPPIQAKILGRLQRRIDKVKIDATEIEMEDAEFDLVKSTFENANAKFIPQQLRVVMSIFENIEKAARGTTSDTSDVFGDE